MAHIETRLEAAVLTVTLNRPERRNAINDEMVESLAQAFDRAAADGEVRVVLLRGEGRDFCAGGDLGGIDSTLAADPAARSEQVRAMARTLTGRLIGAMNRLPQPLILAAQGNVIGAGLQLAAVADLVIASETARFSLPNVALAHTPDHGETWHLRRKIGASHFMQLALLAERIDAATAERIGLANFVVPDDRLEAESQALAARIAAQPPVAAREMKRLLVEPLAPSFEDQLAREQEALGRAVATEDFLEAIQAFNEKRPPVFTGR